MSDDLLDGFAASLRPTPAGYVLRRLLIGLLAGGVTSLALTLVLLGARPDLAQAAGRSMFWVKLAYGLALGAIAVWAAERLTRPGGLAAGRLPWLAAPALLVAGLAAWRLMDAAPEARMSLLMGHSARLCPWYILGCSLPPLAGLVWAVRGLAPTRLRLAGLVLGVAAGGVGAGAYAVHCDEMAAPFLAAWYSLGIAAVGALGWLSAPRLLRW